MKSARNHIYADNAATTRLDPVALDAMLPFLQGDFGNASSVYSLGTRSKRAVTQARAKIARCINAEPDEIVFTSGGTESNNWAIKGIASTNSESRKGIITSPIEHYSVLKPCETLANKGFTVTHLPVNGQGEITTTDFGRIIGIDTSIVSIGLANNEIGTIQDICILADIAHQHDSCFHTDAVQAVGHLPIDVKELGVDSLSASAHKFNGPKGVGFLYVKHGVRIPPLLDGGAQERGLRAGTENVASVVGMAVALENNINSLEQNILHLCQLVDYFSSKLKALIPDLQFNGAIRKLPGHISVSFPETPAEALLHLLDLKNICISSGSACKANATEVSHVLKTIKIENYLLKNTIRISFGKDNTFEEADRMIDAIMQACELVKKGRA